MEDKYIRKVQTSVTCFLHHGDEYLFLKRGAHKRVDPNKLNGVGGRLEPGENFAKAALREIKEETGYDLEYKNITFRGIVKLEGGYQEDWVVCVFTAEVTNKQLAHGHTTEDGEFLWLHKDEALDSGYELVSDITYYFKQLVSNDDLIFLTAKVGEGQKVEEADMTLI